MTEGGYMIRTFDFILKAKYNKAFMEVHGNWDQMDAEDGTDP